MSAPHPDRLRLAESALQFAREHLGPACERLMADPARQALVLSRLRNGAELADAVLAEVHAEVARDREAANEFLAYFLDAVVRRGREALSPGLHRFLDTWDLAQSVFGDLWPDVGSMRFETRAGFLSLLLQRLRWKATGSARRHRREEEGGERELVEQTDGRPSPATRLTWDEDHERLVLVLLRLPPRDRCLLRNFLRGAPIEASMRELGLSRPTAQRALHRAMARARGVLASRPDPPSP